MKKNILLSLAILLCVSGTIFAPYGQHCPRVYPGWSSLLGRNLYGDAKEGVVRFYAQYYDTGKLNVFECIGKDLPGYMRKLIATEEKPYPIIPFIPDIFGKPAFKICKAVAFDPSIDQAPLVAFLGQETHWLKQITDVDWIRQSRKGWLSQTEEIKVSDIDKKKLAGNLRTLELIGLYNKGCVIDSPMSKSEIQKELTREEKWYEEEDKKHLLRERFEHVESDDRLSIATEEAHEREIQARAEIVAKKNKAALEAIKSGDYEKYPRFERCPLQAYQAYKDWEKKSAPQQEERRKERQREFDEMLQEYKGK